MDYRSKRMEEVVNKKITAGKEPMALAATVLSSVRINSLVSKPISMRKLVEKINYILKAD
jgi:hypothetical protein